MKLALLKTLSTNLSSLIEAIATEDVVWDSEMPDMSIKSVRHHTFNTARPLSPATDIRSLVWVQPYRHLALSNRT